MTDYNVSLGKGKDAQSISLNNDMKGGIRKEDIKDKQMQSIFSKLDANNNGILENEEINQINSAISKFSEEDGDVSNLSKKEAKHLIAELGLKGVKTSDLFKFLGTVKGLASNIETQTTDTDGSGAIDVEYKAGENGDKVTKQYDPQTGQYIGSYTVYKNGIEAWRDADNKITRGKDNTGNYTRKYNDDGSYTDTYENNKGTKNYDSNGLLTKGKDADGIEYQRKYQWTGDQAGYTDTYNDGRVRNYNTDGRWLGGESPDGTTYTNIYNADGSFTCEDSNGQKTEYDKNGKALNGTFANGETYECKYSEQGTLEYNEYTQKDGSKYYWGADGKSYAAKTASGSFKVSPIQGETFNDTMERLGITDPADKELFIKSNPKAYRRGYFLLTDAGNANRDVYIPKTIADKLDVKNLLVDAEAELDKHNKARQPKSMDA